MAGGGQEPIKLLKESLRLCLLWDLHLSGYCGGGQYQATCRAAEKPPMEGGGGEKAFHLPTLQKKKKARPDKLATITNNFY